MLLNVNCDTEYLVFIVTMNHQYGEVVKHHYMQGDNRSECKKTIKKNI